MITKQQAQILRMYVHLIVASVINETSMHLASGGRIKPSYSAGERTKEFIEYLDSLTIKDNEQSN